MIGRRLVWILWLLCLLAACSDKGTKPPGPPVEAANYFDGWPSWSPDGRYIYFGHEAKDTTELFRFGQFSIWAYDTQTDKYGFLMGPGMFPKTNPDGTILAFSWGQTLFFYYFDSRTVRQVSHGVEVFEVDWAPSGQSLILSVGDGILIDTLGNIYAHLLPWDMSRGGWRGGWDGDWYADNRILIVSDCLSPDSLRRAGIIILDTLGQIIDTILIDDSPRAHLGGFEHLDMAPGRSQLIANYAYVTADGHTHSHLGLYSRDGILTGILSGDNAGRGKWSPDGLKIVFQMYTFIADNPFPGDPDFGRITPWICNPDGSDMHELLGWPQPAPDTTMFDGGYNWVTDTYHP